MMFNYKWLEYEPSTRDCGGRKWPDWLKQIGFECGCYGWVVKDTYESIGACATHNNGKWRLYVK